MRYNFENLFFFAPEFMNGCMNLAVIIMKPFCPFGQVTQASSLLTAI